MFQYSFRSLLIADTFLIVLAGWLALAPSLPFSVQFILAILACLCAMTDVCRIAECDNSGTARIEVFGKSFDRPPLAGRIPTFKEDHDLLILLL